MSDHKQNDFDIANPILRFGKLAYQNHPDYN